MILLIVSLTVTAVTLGAWAASTTIESKQAVQRSMRAMEGYGAPSTRREEMRVPVAERLLAPLGRALVRVGRWLTTVAYVEHVKRNAVLAGSPPSLELDRFLAWKVLGAAAVPMWWFLVYVVLDAGGLPALLTVALLGVIGVLGPDAALRRRVAQRGATIERALPDVLDLLVISVEAGLGFEQALDRTADAVPGALSEEMRRTLQEIRMGTSRSDALRALDRRTQVDDLRTFVLAMLQADTFGISIARILKNQAEEMRLRRHQRAQTLAQQAPVKMLFPLAVCIFPALFVVLLMPATISIFDAL